MHGKMCYSVAFFTFTLLSNNVEAMLKKKLSNSYSLEEKIVHKPVMWHNQELKMRASRKKVWLFTKKQKSGY